MSSAASVLISSAQAILNLLIPLATEQIKGAWGFKEELETLQRRLSLIQALLCEADNLSLTSPVMQQWLKNLKLATSDTENFLDELAYEALRRKLEKRLMNKVESKYDALLEDLLEKSSKSVRRLMITALEELRCFPSNLQKFGSLKELSISCCPNLTSIIKETPEAFSGLESLQQLTIEDCRELRCLPKGMLQQTPLVTLYIADTPKLIMANPDDLNSLTSLEELTIEECPRLVSCWNQRLLCLASLRKLKMTYCPELDYIPWPSSTSATADIDTELYNLFISLESLTLWGWPRHKCDQLHHLTGLGELSIEHNSGLDALPEWLGNFSSLQSLKLINCQNLCLPSLEAMQRLTNLQSLHICGCRLLKERCKRGSGEEWHKIAHIPSIKISDY